mgnify:CR=1 FL=1
MDFIFNRFFLDRLPFSYAILYILKFECKTISIEFEVDLLLLQFFQLPLSQHGCVSVVGNFVIKELSVLCFGSLLLLFWPFLGKNQWFVIPRVSTCFGIVAYCA